MRAAQYVSLMIALSICQVGWADVHLPANAQALSQDRQILHVLNRLGYGPTPESVAHVKKIGVAAYIDEQLHPSTIIENSALEKFLAEKTTLDTTPAELIRLSKRFERAAMDGQALSAEDVINQRKQFSKSILQDAQSARLARGILSNRQLESVMMDFWFNHFNVNFYAGVNILLMADYDHRVIRPYVFGLFSDLLKSTAHSLAMGNYLNNRENSKVFTNAKGKQFGMNENYAREVMELHTLGVNGGYTQKDVIELARILTGWSYDTRGVNPSVADDLFMFRKDLHDTGDKNLLGVHVVNQGEQEGIQALDLLASKQATALNISKKIAQYFVSDQPSATLIKAMANAYMSTQGDIGRVLEVLFSSDDFWAKKNIGQRFKTPYQYVVSSVRVSGIQPINYQPLISVLGQMSMPIYGYATPDGYKTSQSAWLSSAALATRLDYASWFSRAKVPLLYTDPLTATPLQKQSNTPRFDYMNKILDPIISSNTKKILNQAPASQKLMLLLSSPDFMYD